LYIRFFYVADITSNDVIMDLTSQATILKMLSPPSSPSTWTNFEKCPNQRTVPGSPADYMPDFSSKDAKLTEVWTHRKTRETLWWV